MKIKILKRHFDWAVAKPWSLSTCIIAQAAADYGIDNQYDITSASGEALEIQNHFDAAAHREVQRGVFREPNWEELLNIREFLPLTVYV